MERSAVLDAADAALEAALTAVDPELMELFRLRIGQLLRAGGELRGRDDRLRPDSLHQAKIAALSSYPTSPLFDDRERACIAMAEHVCADAYGVGDDEIARVRGHLGDEGWVAFAYALTLVEGRARIALALGTGS